MPRTSRTLWTPRVRVLSSVRLVLRRPYRVVVHCLDGHAINDLDVGELPLHAINDPPQAQIDAEDGNDDDPSREEVGEETSQVAAEPAPFEIRRST